MPRFIVRQLVSVEMEAPDEATALRTVDWYDADIDAIEALEIGRDVDAQGRPIVILARLGYA